ncbi:hypothetical protein E4T25_04220 [Photobacterium damselae subsp. piscicida]|uniref:hypothetical protein n=1 Tax=Photobacterium damselae TaxID=38293 RepID=UPI00107619A4|nr:hypothetical protein [Photobacterium damselae]TFZ62408.1 hypothetical protein E4T25_04220 [Photobacterium damselae subsp. piscicida]
MLTGHQLHKIDSVIRLTEISTFKPTTFTIGDRWILNNNKEVVKINSSLQSYQTQHQSSKMVRFVFNVTPKYKITHAGIKLIIL